MRCIKVHFVILLFELLYLNYDLISHSVFLFVVQFGSSHLGGKWHQSRLRSVNFNSSGGGLVFVEK